MAIRGAPLPGLPTACVYPIKVNQQRQVVEEVLRVRPPLRRFGLEAGSKPELLAVLALADNETPIVCNGFKDDEYIEMVDARPARCGRRIIPVVERSTPTCRSDP